MLRAFDLNRKQGSVLQSADRHLGVLASANNVSAQLAVIDPANLQQTVLIAQRTAPIAGASHNPARWPYAAAWLQGLNTGDPSGSAYGATTIPLRPVESLPRNMSVSAQRTLSNQIASMELSDSVAMMAGHQIGAIRQYSGVLQKGVDSLEEDVMNGLARYHELTATRLVSERGRSRPDLALNLPHDVGQLRLQVVPQSRAPLTDTVARLGPRPAWSFAIQGGPAAWH